MACLAGGCDSAAAELQRGMKSGVLVLRIIFFAVGQASEREARLLGVLQAVRAGWRA